MNGLPVGFRFYPTEEELLSYYLSNKLNGTAPEIDRVIPVVHIYDYNPWELPQFGGELCPADTEQWFFFTPMQEREARGGRTNRLTETGYWKATGSPSDVYTSQNLRIGRIKTMVFYKGRAPNGTKTNWKMHEYKLFDNHHAANPQLKEQFSLCRIYQRSKCTRAFDRRPLTAASTHDQAAVQNYHHLDSNEVVITVDNQQNPAVESEFNWDMATENELLLDSEVVELLGLTYEKW